jgi:hypothetical protein
MQNKNYYEKSSYTYYQKDKRYKCWPSIEKRDPFYVAILKNNIEISEEIKNITSIQPSNSSARHIH